MTVAAGTERRSGPLRLAAVVYAVVVILGLAGTGAHALWSQSGTAMANISTGFWGPQTITAVACSAELDWRLDTDTLVVNYTAPADADNVEVSVMSGPKTLDTQKLKVGSTRQYSVDFTLPFTLWARESFTLKLTPSYQGIAGETTTRTVNTYKTLLGGPSASCS